MHSQQLVKLVLSENQVGDDGMEAIAAKLPSSLEILDISHNKIGDFGASHLANALARLPELRQLYISANGFGEPGLADIASQLPLCPNLSTLRAAKLGLGDGLKALSMVLSRCPNLQNLSLKENQMGNAAASVLASTLTPFIEELLLDDNGIGDVGIRAIAGRLKDCKRLRVLSLNENCFGDSGAGALVRALPSCPTMCTLRAPRLPKSHDFGFGVQRFRHSLHSTTLPHLLLQVSFNHISPQAGLGVQHVTNGTGTYSGQALTRIRIAAPALNLCAFGQTARAR